jgi:cardiolipin synthase
VLAFKGLIPLWLVVIVVLRDTVILTTVIILKRLKYAINTRPMIAGKLTTFFQVLTVLTALLAQRVSGAYLLYIFTGFITLTSAAQYAFRAFHVDLNIFKSSKSG